MSDTVIKVENVGKLYRLGEIGTGTITNDVNRWWARIRGKDDPYAKIGETNDRTVKGTSDYVWSLKDVSFEVKQGEALGIIGRNGAGKSTLLKILSKVTTPTTGRIKVKGRIASLLEVGTGFHPELTGRENIYLNGAILGMTKAEINKKFDEIVDFSGVERYIDTPVKRYSSGMYVRLAFAVAAFLEPEILIVDEVLAVGDAEFQKKCLGRMKDVSVNDGRTVLFVSHNLTAISALCNNALYMRNGRLFEYGGIKEVLNTYNKSFTEEVQTFKCYDLTKQQSDKVQFLEAKIVNSHGELISGRVKVTDKVGVNISFKVLVDNFDGIPNFIVYDENKKIIVPSIYNPNVGTFKKGKYDVTLWIPENMLNDINYIIGVGLNSYAGQNVITHFYDSEALLLEVVDDSESITRGPYLGAFDCVIRTVFDWTIKEN